MNRFYSPTAPRYTSQFVENQLPTDLMMGYLNMKAGQQTSFAEKTGELEAMAAIIPNGLRSEEMASRVRNKWISAIGDWSSKNMVNYDSPQAISELASIRSRFLQDPDILLMQKDAKDSEDYKKSKMSAGPSHIDPNLEDPSTGRLIQFEEGSTYVPYMPLEEYQDVPKRILEEFSLVPENERTSSYLSYTMDPLTKEIVPIHGTTSTSKTNESQYDITMQDFIRRALEAKEPWARYKNLEFRNMHGRDMMAEDWYDYVSPIAIRTKKYSTADRWNPYSRGSSGDDEQQIMEDMSIPLEMRDDEFTSGSKHIARKMKMATNLSIEGASPLDHEEYRNILYKLAESNSNILGDDQKKQWDEVIKEIKNQESLKSKLNIRPLTKDEKERSSYIYNLFSANNHGVIQTDAVSPALKGMAIYDYETGEKLKTRHRNQLLVKDSYISVDGIVRKESSPLAPFPSTYIISVRNKNTKRQLMVRDPSMSNTHENKIDHNYNNFMKSKDTDIGDPFVLQIGKNNMVNIVDQSDPSMGEENAIIGAGAHELVVLPAKNHVSGNVEVKVFALNPYLNENRMTRDAISSIDPLENIPDNLVGPLAKDVMSQTLGKFMGRGTVKTAMKYRYDDGILDNSNEFFIKQYNIGDEVTQVDENTGRETKYILRTMHDVHAAILRDRNNLLKAKQDILELYR